MPVRIIAPVLNIFSTSLVAVPARMRVDPVITSGPTAGVMAIFARHSTSEPGTQLSPMVSAPSWLA